MHRALTARFVILGVVAAFIAGLVVFMVFYTLYPLPLTADTVQSLAHNGKSVRQASAEFGFLPAILTTVIILACIADRYLERRQLRGI